jgi:sugar phosphate permease
MIRLLLSIVVRLIANAVGLLVAAWVLDDMTLTASAFVVGVLIFTLVEVLVEPALDRAARNQVAALRGGVALFAVFIGLLVTHWVTDGLSISGVDTWVLATLIVWVASLIAALLLPVLVIKRARDDRRNG